MPSFETVPTIETADRIQAEADGLRSGSSADHLLEVISNLKRFLKLKQLAELPHDQLPENLRQTIGMSDPQDEFQTALDDDETADLWFTMQNAYGKDWSPYDVERLITALEG